MNHRKRILLITALLGCSTPGFAQEHFPAAYQPERRYTAQRIHDLTAVPEGQVDIGLWALIIAHTFDPAIDVEANLQQLDSMAQEIRRMLAGRTSDLDKLLAVKTYLYDPGPWNGGQTFDYDLDDPLGQKLENQLLSTYLRTRKGNCVSMPTLFLALMERVDPDVPLHGVAVPLHLFVRLRDRQTGDIWNVETTNRASPARNQWYIEQFSISQEAIEAGTYLRDLTKQEYLGELVGILTRHERAAARYKKALEYAELTLALNPRSINGLVHKGALLEWIVYETVEGARQQGNHLSEATRERMHVLNRESWIYIEQARTLGWQPENPEERERYLQAVEAEKARRARRNH